MSLRSWIRRTAAGWGASRSRGRPRRVCLSRDGRLIAASQGNAVVVFDVETSAEVASLTLFSPPKVLVFGQRRLHVGTEDGLVYAFELRGLPEAAPLPVGELPPKQDGVRRFEHAGRFWEVVVQGKRCIVRFGRVGAEGQKRETACFAKAAAERMEALISGEGEGGVCGGVVGGCQHPAILTRPDSPSETTNSHPATIRAHSGRGVAMRPTVEESSAGVALIQTGGVEPELLVIRVRATGYELPKGHLERGETALAAAVRELQEETGLLTAAVPGNRWEPFHIPSLARRRSSGNGSNTSSSSTTPSGSGLNLPRRRSCVGFSAARSPRSPGSARRSQTSQSGHSKSQEQPRGPLGRRCLTDVLDALVAATSAPAPEARATTSPVTYTRNSPVRGDTLPRLTRPSAARGTIRLRHRIAAHTGGGLARAGFVALIRRRGAGEHLTAAHTTGATRPIQTLVVGGATCSVRTRGIGTRTGRRIPRSSLMAAILRLTGDRSPRADTRRALIVLCTRVGVVAGGAIPQHGLRAGAGHRIALAQGVALIRASQVTEGPATQIPVRQASDCVQGSPSSHVVPSMTGGLEHCPFM